MTVVTLPNLLIIGAAKSGTTAIHSYLNQHPDIYMSTPKEPRFFLVWNNKKWIDTHIREKNAHHNYYSTLENYQSLFAGGADHKIRGESSTAYLTNPECATKIKRLLPDAKILVVLRNPIERAFSNYVMYRNWRMEKLSFYNAIVEELETGRLNYPQPMRYLFMGQYLNPLKTYLEVFDRSQFKILLYEKFVNTPMEFMEDIFNFISVDSSFTPNMQKKHNVSAIKRFAKWQFIDNKLSFISHYSNRLNLTYGEDIIRKIRFYKPTFNTKTRNMLIDFYAKEVADIEMLIRQDLQNWKK